MNISPEKLHLCAFIVFTVDAFAILTYLQTYKIASFHINGIYNIDCPKALQIARKNGRFLTCMIQLVNHVEEQSKKTFVLIKLFHQNILKLF